MHELSIATAIRDNIIEEVRKRGKTRVNALVLEMGRLSGVEINALLFLWEDCMRGTLLEGASLQVIQPEGKGQCNTCNTIFPMEELATLCPKCRSAFKRILQGQELRIKSLTLG